MIWTGDWGLLAHELGTTVGRWVPASAYHHDWFRWRDLLTRRAELARLEAKAWEALAFEIAYDRERVRIVNRAYEAALRVCPPHATDEAERAASADAPRMEVG